MNLSSTLSNLWTLLLRLAVGGFWLFFASQRWLDRAWVKPLLETAADGNYLPFYRDLLRQAAQSWETVTLAVTAAETIVGVMIVLGFFPRAAAAAGAFIALNLWLTFSFCNCPWNRTDAPQVFWFYFSAFLLNLAVLREKTHPSLLRGRKKMSRG
ncbi:MAG: DoxX family membrane protein [Candidatus Caldarchaeum sp.]